MKNNFSTLDVKRILKIKRHRLQKWLEYGFIKPSVQRAEGQGTKSLFSLEDLYRIELFRIISEELGLLRTAASVLVMNVTLQDMEKYYSIKPGTPGETSWIGKLTKEADKFIKEQDTFSIVINLKGIKRSVDKKIAESK